MTELVGGTHSGITNVNTSRKPQGARKATYENVRFTSFLATTEPRSVGVLGSNRNRRSLTIQNTGTVTIFVGFGTRADIRGYQIPANSEISYTSGIVPYNEINLYSTTVGECVVVEGSKDSA